MSDIFGLKLSNMVPELITKGTGASRFDNANGNAYWPDEIGTYTISLGAYDGTFDQDCRYIANGRHVVCGVRIYNMSDLSDNSQLRIIGHPFTVRNDINPWGGYFTLVQSTVPAIISVEGQNVYGYNRNNGGNFRYSDMDSNEFKLKYEYIRVG